MLLLIGGGSVGVAAPVDEANALIAKGNALRMAGDDVGSLPLLQQAYQINPGPRTAVHLGMAEYAVGRWADADLHLTEALKSRDDPWVKKNETQILESLRITKTHVSRIEITGDPPGAEVLVNGRAVGRLPLSQPVAVSAGSVDIEVRAPGYEPGSRTLAVTGGQYQPVVIRLARSGTPADSGPGASGRSAGPPRSFESELDDTDRRELSLRPLIVGISLGGAGLGLALGGYGVWQHEHHATAFNKRGCFEAGNGSAIRADGLPDDACKRSMSGYREARILQVLGFATAGALAGAALVAYLVGSSSQSSASAPLVTSIACAPAFFQVGLGCEMRF